MAEELNSFNKIKHGDIIEIWEKQYDQVFRGVALFLEDNFWSTDANYRVKKLSDGNYSMSLGQGKLSDENYFNDKGEITDLTKLPTKGISSMGMVGQGDFTEGNRVFKLNSLYETTPIVTNLKLIP